MVLGVRLNLNGLPLVLKKFKPKEKKSWSIIKSKGAIKGKKLWLQN